MPNRIDANVVCNDLDQYLLKSINSPFVIISCIRNICGLIAQGERIQAIRATRHYYGWGLKESKDFVDMLQDTLAPPNTGLQTEVDKLKQDLLLANKRVRDATEATWQNTLRSEATIRDLKKLISDQSKALLGRGTPGQPFKRLEALETVDSVRKTFKDYFLRFVGAGEAVGNVMEGLEEQLSDAMRGDNEKPLTARQWRDEFAGLFGAVQAGGKAFDALIKEAEILRDQTLGTKSKSSGTGNLLEYLTSLGLMGAGPAVKDVMNALRGKDATGTKVGVYDPPLPGGLSDPTPTLDPRHSKFPFTKPTVTRPMKAVSY